MNALTPFASPYLAHPVWHRFPQATVRLEVELQIRGVYYSTLNAEIVVYTDPADNDWQIGEMLIVGEASGCEMLIPVDRHPNGGRSEEGYLAAAIERTARASEEEIVDALLKAMQE